MPVSLRRDLGGDRPECCGAAPIFRGRAMGIFPTLYCGAFAVIAAVVAWKSRERGARFSRVLLVAALAVAVLPSLLPDRLDGESIAAAAAQSREARRRRRASRSRSWPRSRFDGWRARPRRLRLGRSPSAACSRPRLRSPRSFRRRRGALALAAIGGSGARLAAIAASRLPGALAEGGLLWMMTVVALDLLRRGHRRGPRRGGHPADRRARSRPTARSRRRSARRRSSPPPPSRGSSRGAIRRANTGRSASRSSGGPRSSSSRRTPALSRIRSSAAARGRSTRPCSGTAGRSSTRTSTPATCRASRACARSSGYAPRGFSTADAFFGSRGAQVGHPVSRPDARCRATTRSAATAPGLGRARARVSRHPAARGVAGSGRVARGAPGDPAAEGGGGRSSRAASTARAARARGSGACSSARPSAWCVDVTSPGPVLALRPAGLLAVPFGPHRRAAGRGRARAARVLAPSRFRPGGTALEWDEHLPGWALSRYGPVLFGMIARRAACCSPRDASEAMTRRWLPLGACCWRILLGAAGCARKPTPLLARASRTSGGHAEEWLREEPIRLLRDYVRIDTTSEKGERAGAEFLRGSARLRGHRDGDRLPGAGALQPAGAAAGPDAARARSCCSTTSTSSTPSRSSGRRRRPSRARSSAGFSTGAAPTT